MLTILPARWLATFLALLALAASAASAQNHAATGPTASAAPFGSLIHHSAMDGYQPFTDDAAIPWKAANDTVRLRGGWRAYAAEAAEAAGDGAGGAKNPHAAHSMHMPMHMPASPAPKEQP